MIQRFSRWIVQGTALAPEPGMSTLIALVPSLVAVGIFVGVFRLPTGR